MRSLALAQDSWAVFPTMATCGSSARGDDYVIEQVRDDSPAAQAGIRAGDRLVADRRHADRRAVADFWSDLGALAAAARRLCGARPGRRPA